MNLTEEERRTLKIALSHLHDVRRNIQGPHHIDDRGSSSSLRQAGKSLALALRLLENFNAKASVQTVAEKIKKRHGH